MIYTSYAYRKRLSWRGLTLVGSSCIEYGAIRTLTPMPLSGTRPGGPSEHLLACGLGVARHRDKEAAHDCAICVRTEMPIRTSRQQRPLQPRKPTLVCRHFRHAPAIDTERAQLEERLSRRREHLRRRHTCSAFRPSYSVSDAQPVIGSNVGMLKRYIGISKHIPVHRRAPVTRSAISDRTS
jgi:hypothetical protein